MESNDLVQQIFSLETQEAQVCGLVIQVFWSRLMKDGGYTVSKAIVPFCDYPQQ